MKNRVENLNYHALAFGTLGTLDPVETIRAPGFELVFFPPRLG